MPRQKSPVNDVNSVTAHSDLVTKVVSEVLAKDPSDDLSEKLTVLSGIKAVNGVMTLTETRKIDKVEYSVTFPDPAKVTLSADQTAVAVKAFFASKVGYVLRQNVKSESETLEKNQVIFDRMKKFATEKMKLDEAAASEMSLTFCKEQDVNFRLEPTKAYVISLDDIFKPEKPEEEKKEGEAAEETKES
jgi:hypothetical protein